MEAVQETRREARNAGGTCVILFDAARLPQAEADWFEPAYWGEQASPVASGGRGSAWFVRTPTGDAVLRHYRRGGRVAAMLGDRYLWRGEDASRAFREFRLLAALKAKGLPVPRPLGARLRRKGPWYRADLLVERIDGARSLAEAMQESLPAQPWERIGAVLARFHRCGAFHADLNAHNLLLDRAGAVWLIDFDRGEHRRPATGWAMQNLARLSRSLRKLCPTGQEAALELCLARLGQGWRQGWDEGSSAREPR